VAHRRLLKLSTLGSEEQEIVASLQDLNEHDHLLILEQVEPVTLEAEWVFADHSLYLEAELRHQSLVEMAITSGVRRICRNWIDRGPSSLWFGIANCEYSKAKEGNERSVEHHRSQQDEHGDGQEHSELQSEAN